MKKNLLRFALFSVFLMALVDCGSNNSSTDSNGTSPNFTSIYSTILSPLCVQCHQPGGAAVQQGVNLDFTSQASAYQGLTTSHVSSINESGTCGSVPLVSAGNPSASYLLAVVAQAYNIPNFAGANGCTPLASHIENGYVNQSQAGAIAAWIHQGAPNN
jgi:hypothetical protein